MGSAIAISARDEEKKAAVEWPEDRRGWQARVTGDRRKNCWPASDQQGKAGLISQLRVASGCVEVIIRCLSGLYSVGWLVHACRVSQ